MLSSRKRNERDSNVAHLEHPTCSSDILQLVTLKEKWWFGLFLLMWSSLNFPTVSYESFQTFLFSKWLFSKLKLSMTWLDNLSLCWVYFCSRNLENTEKPVYSVKAHSQIINAIDGVGGLGVGEGAPEIVTASRDGKVLESILLYKLGCFIGIFNWVWEKWYHHMWKMLITFQDSVWDNQAPADMLLTLFSAMNEWPWMNGAK